MSDQTSPTTPAKRRLNWDAPASEAEPEWTSERSLREHVRTLVSGGRTVSSIAEQLHVKPVTVSGALKRPDRPAATGPAPVTGGGTPSPSSPQSAAPSAPAALAAVPTLAASADWVACREMVAAADADELAEFFAAYSLSDRFDAFVTGLRRGRNQARPAA